MSHVFYAPNSNPSAAGTRPVGIRKFGFAIHLHMKKFLLFTLGLFLLGGEVSAQDLVYLRNGSMIRGSVLEQEIGKSIKVQTQDGSIYVYSMSEVERVAKEKEPIQQPVQQSVQQPAQQLVQQPVRQRNTNIGTTDYALLQEQHRGLDFNVDFGYHIATAGGSGSFFTQLGLGKRFNPNFYWGLGAGVMLPASGNSDPIIPVTSDFRLYFPFHSSKLVLGGTMRLGYALNMADDITIGTGKRKQTIEMPNYVMIQVLPTLTVPISRRTDFNVGIGYTHFIATGGGSGNGAFTLSTGFNFGKPLSFAKAQKAPKERKPKKPILDRGIQLSLDFGGTGLGSDKNYAAVDVGLTASYQFNPHLAVGLGFGLDIGDVIPPYEAAIYDEAEGYYVDYYYLQQAYKFFVRGAYRFSKKRFSPLVMCDVGIRFIDWGGCEEWEEDSTPLPSSTQYFVAPAVGGSLRMGSNSYLDLKVGYTFGIGGFDKEYQIDEGLTGKCEYEKKLSGLLLKLGFTHTFGWGSGKKR